MSEKAKKRKEAAASAAAAAAAAEALKAAQPMELPKVPASRPLQDGLEERYVLKLLERDDEDVDLETMLKEEVLDVAGLLKRKREAERAGAWTWDAGKRVQRFHLLAAGEAVGDNMLEAHERREDKPGSFAAMLKLRPARPRSALVCTWSGRDEMENLYVCNSDVVAPGRLFCGYHMPSCIGDHGRAEAIPNVAPNADGLCLMHFQEKHAGKAPKAYENELLIPGIAFSAPANRRHPMAPQKYDTIARHSRYGSGSGSGSGGGGGRSGTGTGTGSEEGLSGTAGAATSKRSASGGTDAGPVNTAEAMARAEKESMARMIAAVPRVHSKLYLALLKERGSGSANSSSASSSASSSSSSAGASTAAASAASAASLLPRMFSWLSKPLVLFGRTEASVQRERHLAATMVQKVWRGALVLRAYLRVRREARWRARAAAASLFQRNWRRIRQQRAFKMLQQSKEAAAERIQRLFRRYAWLCRLRRDQELRAAAVGVQRWWRFLRLRWRLRIVYARAEAHRAALAKGRPTDTVYKLARLAQFRRVVRDVKRRKKVVNRAAIILQRAWCWYVRRPQATPGAQRRARALSLLRGMFFMMKWVKNKVRRYFARKERAYLVACCKVISRVGRGFLARVRVRARRERLAAVWGWLAPTLGREIIAEHLGFPDYDRMFRKQLKRLTSRSSKEFAVGAGGGAAAAAAATGEPGLLEYLDEDWEDPKRKAEREAAEAAAREHELWGKHPHIPWYDGNSPEEMDDLRESDSAAAAAIIEVRRKQRAQFEAIKDVEAGQEAAAKVYMDALGDDMLRRNGCNVTAEDEKVYAKVMQRISDSKRVKMQSTLLPMHRAHGALAPKIEDEYARMLKPGRQPMPRPLISSVNRMTYDQRDAMAAYVERVGEALRQADKEAVGLLSITTFERVLAASGCHAPPRIMRDMSLSFALPGGAQVQWGEFLAFARRLDRPCPVHRVLVCPACIYAGQCDKCVCKVYKNNAGSKSAYLLINPHDATCVCGHMRARHAPRMTEHPDLDLPAARAPALEIALARSVTVSPALKRLSGLAPASVDAVAAAAFSPAPLTIQAGVSELQGVMPRLEMSELVPREGGRGGQVLDGVGMGEDMDAGIGSVPYFTGKRAEARLASLRSGLGLQDPAMAEHNFSLRRPVLGLEAGPAPTVALRLLPTGSAVPQNPMAPPMFAALETLLGDIEHTSTSRRLPRNAGARANAPVDATAPLVARHDIPHTAAVHALTLTQLTAANTALLSLANMSSQDTTQKLAGMAGRAGAAAAAAAREAAGAGGGVTEAPKAFSQELSLRASGLLPPSSPLSAQAPGLQAQAQARRSFTRTGSLVGAEAPLLYVEALKAGEVLAAGDAAPSAAGMESLLKSGIAVARGVKLARMAAADKARRSPWAAGATSSSAPSSAAVTLPASSLISTGRPGEGKLVRGEGEAPASATDARPTAVLPAPLPPRSTAREMFTYLMLLRALALPAEGTGYDLLADPSRMSTLILDSRPFLQLWWRALCSDIRQGVLQGGPPGVLSPPQRAALSAAILTPQPGRAAILTTIFTAMRFTEGGRPIGAGGGAMPAPPSAKELYELTTPHAPMPPRLARERAARDAAAQAAVRAQAEAGEASRMAYLIAANMDAAAGERERQARAAAKVARKLAREESAREAERREERRRERDTLRRRPQWMWNERDKALMAGEEGDVAEQARYQAQLRSQRAGSAGSSRSSSSRAGGGGGGASEQEEAEEAAEAEARARAYAAGRTESVRASLAAWQAGHGQGKDSTVRVPKGGPGSPTPLHALPPSRSGLPPIQVSLRGNYSLQSLLQPGAPVRTPYAAPVVGGREAVAAVASAAAQLQRSAALGRAAAAAGKTMRSGAGRPASFVENLGVLFGGPGGAQAVLARSELFTELVVEQGGVGGGLRLAGGGGGGGGGGRGLSLAVDGVGPLVGEDGSFLGYFHVSPAGELEPVPEELLALLLGGGGGGAHSQQQQQPPPPPPPDAAATTASPPMYLNSPPSAAALQARVGYSFFRLPGGRPRGCKYPGCGAVFGSTGAAIRHLKLAHAAWMAPLNTPSDSDAWLGGYFREQGIAQGHWLGMLKVVLQNKAALSEAKRARKAAEARRL